MQEFAKSGLQMQQRFHLFLTREVEIPNPNFEIWTNPKSK